MCKHLNPNTGCEKNEPCHVAILGDKMKCSEEHTCRHYKRKEE